MDQKTSNNDVVTSMPTTPSENATRPDQTDLRVASPAPVNIAAPSNESGAAQNVVPAVAGDVANEAAMTVTTEASPTSPSGASQEASDAPTSEQAGLVTPAAATEKSSDLNATRNTGTTEAANNASSPAVPCVADEAAHTVATVTSPESPSSASSEHASDNPELWIPGTTPTENTEKLTNVTSSASVSGAASTAVSPAGSSSSEEANTVAAHASPEPSSGAPTEVASRPISDDPEYWTPNVTPAGSPATSANVTTRPEESSAPASTPVPNETVRPAPSVSEENVGAKPAPEAVASPKIATAQAGVESVKHTPGSINEIAEDMKKTLREICDTASKHPDPQPTMLTHLKTLRDELSALLDAYFPSRAAGKETASSSKIARVNAEEERKRLAEEAYTCWGRSVQARVADLTARLADITMKVGVAEEFDIKLPDVADLGCVFKPLTNDRGIIVTISPESGKPTLHISGTPSTHLPTPTVPLLEISFDPSDRLLEDYEIIRSIRPDARSRALKPISSSWTLSIRPDPRSMWNETPFKENEIYYKPDVAFGFCEAPDGFRVLAGSQKGRSHWHVGSARDDDFAVVYRNGWNFLAVADGAGSRQFSRQGSKLACQFAAERIFSLITPELEAQAQAFVRAPNDTNAYVTFKRSIYETLVRTIFDAKTRIEKEATQSNRKAGDFATTMLCALVKKFDEGWCIASFMVGDGAMALYDARHGVRVLGDPDEGEYGGQTVFITMDEVWEDANKLMNRVRVAAEPDFTALFLMTDGVSDPKFETTNQLANKDRWKALCDELRPEILSELDAQKAAEHLACKWLKFYSEGNHDDRTLVVMHRPEEKQ